VAVVLQGRARTLGVIVATCDQVAAYGEEDVAILELLAAHVAIALENGALFAEVERLATTDPLTGLANRRHFFAQARMVAARCHGRGRPVAVALLDLDHFKQVNDTYGHQTGDLALQEVARICRECVRANDIVGRYGGEELAILMPDTDAAGAARVAERARAAIAAGQISVGDATFTMTASFGVAVAPPSGSVEAALACADAALYAAKDAGRNRVVVG
jgi:diguanylate cyclase (GGDEF)-like protein